MEIASDEPTAGEVAGVEEAVVEIACIEDTVLEGNVQERLFLRVQPDVNLKGIVLWLVLNFFADIKVGNNLSVTLCKCFPWLPLPTSGGHICSPCLSVSDIW